MELNNYCKFVTVAFNDVFKRHVSLTIVVAYTVCITFQFDGTGNKLPDFAYLSTNMLYII